MKKYITTALLLTTLIFTACAQHRKTVKKHSKPGKVSALNISSVAMSRGACFGRCPIYTVTINSNGLVQYKGKGFTEHMGVYEKKFTPQQVATVLQDFKDNRVDTCAANYEQLIADVPGIYYKIIINGKEKNIGNAHFGPAFLKQLAQDVDAFGQVDNSWKKISSDVPE